MGSVRVCVCMIEKNSILRPCSHTRSGKVGAGGLEVIVVFEGEGGRSREGRKNTNKIE